MSDLDKFEEFLKQIDLNKYRKLYSKIKLVELDLPRNIQAINHLYEYYWTKRDGYLGYEDFYKQYLDDLQKEIEEFREESLFSKDMFYLGLPARIYRTWASLLTQIQGGYVAENMYGSSAVDMSSELDYRGVDFSITINAKTINVQIKKQTASREVRAPWKQTKRSFPDPVIIVEYEVLGDIYKKDGSYRKPYLDWQKKWSGKLKRLDNGFIIFLPDMFSTDHLLP